MRAAFYDREAIRTRAIPLVAALLVCWIIWITALTWLAFDGVIFLIMQAVLGAVLSAIATTISFVAGVFIRTVIPAKAIWQTLCLALLIGSGVTLIDGKHLGLSHTYTDPNSLQPFVGLSQFAFVAAFFVLNFAIANWPIKKATPLPKVGGW